MENRSYNMYMHMYMHMYMYDCLWLDTESRRAPTAIQPYFALTVTTRSHVRHAHDNNSR